jgi:hypothetical protein
MILTEEDIILCAKNFLRRIMGSSSASGIAQLMSVMLFAEPPLSLPYVQCNVCVSESDKKKIFDGNSREPFQGRGFWDYF